jgi:hypothetical protein
MFKYHKIHTVFKRDPNTNFKTLLMDEYSLPEFEYLQDAVWEYTEKVDGTNIRVSWNGSSVRCDGKTDEAMIPSKLVFALQSMFPAEKMFEVFGTTYVTLFGEGYGAGIQKGGVYRPDQSFVLLDVFIGGYWLRRKDVEAIAGKLGIVHVPMIGCGTLHAMVTFAREGFNSAWGNFLAEGIVARPAIQLFNRSGDRIITKIKYKDFVR